MRVKTETTRRRRGSFRLLFTRLGLAVILMFAASLQGAEVTKNQLLDCNSALQISHALKSMAGGSAVFGVTITVTNVLSTDAANMPVDQVFDKVDYFPSCTSTLPCAKSPVGTVNYVAGSVGGTCPNLNVMDMGDQVLFNFVPDIPLGPPTAMTSCTITFDEMMPNPGTYTSEVTTGGVCQVPGIPLNSNSTVTDQVTFAPVPTLGQFGWMILALILACGSILILRRKAVPNTLGS